MLLSGNGRHRRPRPAPKFVVAAGVTGAGIALPLLGASGAEAASSSTWDAVAQCESDNSWSSDTGNGYFGGLQLSQQIWEAYGGKEYAERADLASRSEQISVAERVLADQGPGVWPSCSLTAGLDEGGPSPEASEGLPEPTQQKAQGAQGAAGTPGSGDSDADEDDQDPAQDSVYQDDDQDPAQDGSREEDVSSRNGEEDDSEEDQEAGPAGRAFSDPWTPGGPGSFDTFVEIPEEPEIEQELTQPSVSGDAVPSGDDSEESYRDDPDRGAGAVGGRASRSMGTHRSPDAEDEEGGGGYTVGPGDTLYAIADSEDVHGGWERLYKANKGTVGNDPDLIRPGQELTLG